MCLFFVLISFFYVISYGLNKFKEAYNNLKKCSDATTEKRCNGVVNNYCFWYKNKCYDYGECKRAHNVNDCKTAGDTIQLPCNWTVQKYGNGWGGYCDLDYSVIYNG